MIVLHFCLTVQRIKFHMNKFLRHFIANVTPWQFPCVLQKRQKKKKYSLPHFSLTYDLEHKFSHVFLNTTCLILEIQLFIYCLWTYWWKQKTAVPCHFPKTIKMMCEMWNSVCPQNCSTTEQILLFWALPNDPCDVYWVICLKFIWKCLKKLWHIDSLYTLDVFGIYFCSQF